MSQTAQQHHDDGSVSVDVGGDAVRRRGRHRAAGASAWPDRSSEAEAAIGRRRASTPHASRSSDPTSGGRPAPARSRSTRSRSPATATWSAAASALRGSELSDRPRRGRRALCLARQRPRDLLPRRQLDPGRRAAVTGHAGADARAARSPRADANMNMIRVWGGGFYEPDFFYDLCDELGPAGLAGLHVRLQPLSRRRRDFLAEVAREVDQQVRRLGSHPSIAHLVRRQRTDRRADLVRGIAQEPRPLSRQLRPPQPHDRGGDAGRRSRRDLVAVEPIARHALVRRRLARRFLRRHAFLERLARGPATSSTTATCGRASARSSASSPSRRVP